MLSAHAMAADLSQQGSLKIGDTLLLQVTGDPCGYIYSELSRYAAQCSTSTRCASRSFLSNTVAQPTIASLYFQSVKIRRRVLAFQMLLVSYTRQHVVCVRAARACILCRTALFCTQMQLTEFSH